MPDYTPEFIDITYQFNFDDGLEKVFHVKLDYQTLELVYTPQSLLPEWVELDFYKCPNCTLDIKQHPYCPVASSMLELINFFKNMYSYQEVEVRITTQERTFYKKTVVQKGVSSLMGIYTVSCGCPILARLRPMVRFHLPFATIEETLFRVVSMYMLQEYFKPGPQSEKDWSLDRMKEDYQEISIVNTTFYERLSNIEAKDAHINALIILDIFAKYITSSLGPNPLSRIERYFKEQDFIPV